MPCQFVKLFFLAQREGVPVTGVAGVQFHHLAGLGVLERQPAQRGQPQFMVVGDVHGHHIVPAIGLAQDRLGGARQRPAAVRQS